MFTDVCQVLDTDTLPHNQSLSYEHLFTVRQLQCTFIRSVQLHIAVNSLHGDLFDLGNCDD